jgi:CDP-paratose 2-epimerase
LKHILITGCGGLIGSQSAEFFLQKKFSILGIDNNLRKFFFGKTASVNWRILELKKNKKFKFFNLDIRNNKSLEKIFIKYNINIDCIIHCAAQPSHDLAAKFPIIDFEVNANGTLNLLELSRKYCPKTTFIFLSTNKVYGDTPNRLPFVEKEKRYELNSKNKFFKKGINESMSIDNSKHSLFGVSKLSADILVQEFGRYFGMKTVCFRAGCLTGSLHSSAELHGFLSYLVKCIFTSTKYIIFGYKGKQVRDNIHSYDLVNMLWHYYKKPRAGEVYNVGGSRFSNCSILEAIEITEKILKKKAIYSFSNKERSGDHIWWISDISKFKKHYPKWDYKFDLTDIIKDIIIRLKKSQIKIK